VPALSDRQESSAKAEIETQGSQAQRAQKIHLPNVFMSGYKVNGKEKGIQKK